MSSIDRVLERLEEQISWYDRRSQSNQRWYKWMKGTVLVMAAVIPFLAGQGVPRLWTGVLGILIVVLESLQQLNQYHRNWITYRSTCEALKHEKYLFLGQAGPYATARNPQALLAERVECIVSQEHAKWLDAQEMAQKFVGKGDK